jgi:hypothetical protein
MSGRDHYKGKSFRWPSRTPTTAEARAEAKLKYLQAAQTRPVERCHVDQLALGRGRFSDIDVEYLLLVKPSFKFRFISAQN